MQFVFLMSPFDSRPCADDVGLKPATTKAECVNMPSSCQRHISKLRSDEILQFLTVSRYVTRLAQVGLYNGRTTIVMSRLENTLH